MKNNYLFLISIIIIVVIWSLWYCILIEPMETSDESKINKLQEIMVSFSKDIADKTRDLIFTKTKDSENQVDKDIAKHNQDLKNISDDINNTNKDNKKKSEQLLKLLDKMILEENSKKQQQVTSGISIEIQNEQEKIRSIVNKYIQ